MNVLGISGRGREAAAALVAGDQLVAAAVEGAVAPQDGATPTGGGGWPMGAIRACLDRAGLSLGQIDRIAVADARRADRNADVQRSLTLADAVGTMATVDSLHADAAQAAAAAPRLPGTVLVASTQPRAIAIFLPSTQGVDLVERVGGMHDLLDAALVIADALGLVGDDPLQTLDRLSLGGDADALFDAAVQWRPSPATLDVDVPRVREIVAAAGAANGGQLDNAASLNVALQRARHGLAASFLAAVARGVAASVRDLSTRRGSPLALGGDLFSHPRLCAELGALVGDDVSIAPVPERQGRAIGAALLGAAALGGRWPGLGLGPSFTEADIKHTLDNCRLDYVYEPDWSRLHARVSRMLAQGKIVGWFQGPMAFGPRSFGSRSILCDPSGRYARHNINEYLRQQPLDEPLPLVFAPSSTSSTPALHARPFEVRDAEVPAAWHASLTAALDWRQHVRVHGVGVERAPELCQLLETHFKATGIPALIETPLGREGVSAACTPRDAVRTVYSSAVDALVVGRLLLMKDHWLLRTETA